MFNLKKNYNWMLLKYMYIVFRHAFLRLICLIKSIYYENSYLHIRYLVIYRIFIKQPCIDYFTKRYWSKHRKICSEKYVLFTWWICKDEWILRKIKRKNVCRFVEWNKMNEMSNETRFVSNKSEKTSSEQGGGLSRICPRSIWSKS